MEDKIIQFAAHTAILRADGIGALIMPEPQHDVRDPEPLRPSLHEQGWSEAIKYLDAMGWEPEADNDGLPCHLWMTADGREVIALGGPCLVGADSLADIADGFGELALHLRRALCLRGLSHSRYLPESS